MTLTFVARSRLSDTELEKKSSAGRHLVYRRMLRPSSNTTMIRTVTAVDQALGVCRDSSVAVYNTCNESNVGFIETFLRVYNCECINCSCDSKIIALVKKCEVVKKFKTLIPEVFVPNVAEYKLTEEYEVVCPTNLQGVCVNMKINDKHYISKPTNTMEVE
ncbi:uncharacterized protein LOC113213077 [Frankliniella occidentalis]|uniref:Uncharacterized protein LOC113213077 n=1 Tax=Frankliniella occidentalis TaxID=133901 RepID=A0A6J1TAP4_FRAOC|nr:uncharacterized protein LOC113213077 [Frankliniella occidentalis]